MARTPLLPAEPNGNSERVLSGPLLEAVRFASRSLATVADDDLLRDERLATTVHAYERRARTRATPRGTFAGVQTAEVTDAAARLKVGTNHRARSVPSAAWLSELAERLVEVPDVLAGLRLTSNELVVRRGDRFEHEHATGAKKPERVTLRATPAVELILETCQTSARLDTITAAIDSRWPGVPASTVHATVLNMVRAGLLLNDLLPDDVAQDPLGVLLTKLPTPHKIRTTLGALRDALAEADKYPPGSPDRLAALAEARDLCDSLARHETPIVVDVAIDADLQVPASLIARATDTASLLWTITPAVPVLEVYQARFLERYGTGRRVPLLNVVDPVTGLGNPDDVERPTPAEDRARTRVLAGLVARSAAEGTTQVLLDEATVAALRVAGDVPPPANGELYVRVLARSAQDLAAGRYDLAAYLGCTQDAGSTLGRFASLLDLSAPNAVDESLKAEVVVRPRLAALTTVALPSGFAPLRICVGVVPEPDDLTLSDLELASDGQRLTLWSRRLDRQIVPTLFSRIGSTYVPPAVRLLQDLANAGTRPWHTWTWGPLADAPFLPGVRWRRSILSPARWRLPHALAAAVADTSAWNAELDAWRSTALPRPPRIVVAQDADQRLPLDLTHPRDRDLLRRYVRRGADTVSEEAGGPDAVQAVADGPDGRHVLELVIPLQAREPRPAPKERRRPVAATAPVVHLPGGPWLSLTITSPGTHHDDLLTQIRDVATVVRDDVDRYFWLRYDNKAHGPHVRVRFAGDPANLNGRVLPVFADRCATWIARSLAGQLIVEPYEPETDRYGGAGAIEQAEHLFDADSSLVLELLHARPDDDTRLLLAALSAVALTRELADGDPAAVSRPRLDKAARRKVNDLQATAQSNSGTLLDDTQQHAWDGRARAVAAYGDVLPAHRRADCTSSVIHMHANRMGLDHDQERIARALAAQLLARCAR